MRDLQLLIDSHYCTSTGECYEDGQPWPCDAVTVYRELCREIRELEQEAEELAQWRDDFDDDAA